MRSKQRGVSLSQSDRERYTCRKNRIWFAGSPDHFSTEGIVDITSHLPKKTRHASTFGAFVHCSLGIAERIRADKDPMVKVGAAVAFNLASPGFLLPTSSLNESWKFELNEDPENQTIELRAITLMVLCRIRHKLERQDTFVGAAQPLYSLDVSEGTCFERASILAAVFRLNNIPARIVGNPDFLTSDSSLLPIQRHHWWIEAYINGEWVAFDPNLNSPFVSLHSRLSQIRHSNSLREFIILLGFFEALSLERNIPLRVIDDPEFEIGVENRVIAPEVDVPEGYPLEQT